MSPFSFTSNDIPFKLKQITRHRTWIERVILANHKFPGAISFIFCSDAFLGDMNKEYLKHNTLTDIITFNYNAGNTISGDIFISIERVEENATKFDSAFYPELQRVMIHGILHLIGYNDKNPSDEKQMRQKENESLVLLERI